MALAVVAAAAAGLARADIRPLTLYQRVGRTPWVILGEITDGDDRFAEVKVIEVLKGKYDRPTLRVVYRLENFLRKSWQEKLDFEAGEKAILFVKRYETDREDGKVPEKLAAEDVFAPTFGAEAKFRLPEEGEAAYMEALREYARATEIEDPDAHEAALLGFLTARNPHVLSTGLEQVLERRLALDEHVPLLLDLCESDREPVRLNALQILGQVAEDLRAAGRTLPDHPDVVNRLKGKVVGDGSDPYRAEAVKVVAALAGEAERAFIERIAKEDPSQLVRYQAGTALLALGGR